MKIPKFSIEFATISIEIEIIAIQIEIIANPTDKYPLVSVLDTDSHTLKHTNLLISLYSHADVGAW